VATGRKRTIVFDFIVDDADAKRKLGNIERSTDGMGRKFQSAANLIRTAMAITAGGAVVEFGRRMDELNVQAETNRRRFETVFGDMAGIVAQWVDDQNENFGIAEETLMGLASGVGDLLVPMGFARDEAANMTTDILEVANALSEWAGIDVEDAVRRITSAMLGEREGLKELGVKISQEELNALLAADGLGQLEGSARTAAEAQGTFEIIVDRSKDALDAYNERAGTSIARNKEIAASTADAEVALAQGLQPVLDAVKRELGEAAENAAWLSEIFEDISGPAGDAADETADLGIQSKSLVQIMTQGGLVTLNDMVTTLRLWTEDGGKASSKTGELVDKTRELTDALITGGGSRKRMVDDFGEIRDSIQETTDALRDHNDEVKQSIDPVFNLTRKMDAYNEKFEAVNRLARDGETDSREYRDAVLDLLAAQSDLNIAMSTYAEEGGQDSIDALLELARQAGIAEEDIYDLIAAMESLNSVSPTQGTIRTGPAGEYAFQHGGIVPGPRGAPVRAIVHGGETVLPTHKAGFQLAATPNVVVHVAGSVIAEKDLAETLRRELARIERRM
jgi:hypothetical protein